MTISFIITNGFGSSTASSDDKLFFSPMASTSSPVSSLNSLIAASLGVSLASTWPPGYNHFFNFSWYIRSTSSLTINTPPATMHFFVSFRLMFLNEIKFYILSRVFYLQLLLTFVSIGLIEFRAKESLLVKISLKDSNYLKNVY